MRGSGEIGIKTQRMESGSVFVAIGQVIILLMIWGLSAICDLLILCVYRLSRFGVCDIAVRLIDRLCERGSAEMDIEDNDVRDD